MYLKEHEMGEEQARTILTSSGIETEKNEKHLCKKERHLLSQKQIPQCNFFA